MNIIEFTDYIESKAIAWIRRRMKHNWKVVIKILYKTLNSNSPTLDRLDIIKDREQRRTNVWCPQECPDLTWHFLASTTSSSVNRFIPSVRPSVRLTITPFSLCSPHRIIIKFSNSNSKGFIDSQYMVQQLKQETPMCYSKPKKQTNVEIQTVTHFTLYQVHFTEDWSLEDINFGYNFEPSVTCLSLVYIWIITQVKGGWFVLCMLQIYKSLMVNGTINEACKLEKIFLCKHVMTETRSYNDLKHDKMAND